MTNFALNPFKKGKKTEIEGKHKVEAEKDPLLLAIKCHELISIENKKDEMKHVDDFKMRVPIIEPKYIDDFVKYVSTNGKDLSFKTGNDLTSHYISRLIQGSYLAGHNDFVINDHEYYGNDLFDFLIGRKDNMLRLKVYGEVCDESFQCIEYCSIEVNGNVGPECGMHAEFSKLTINGNVSAGICEMSKHNEIIINGDLECSGYSANKCKFIVNGNTGDSLGTGSQNSTFLVYGNVGIGCGQESEYSKFFFKDFEEEDFSKDSYKSTYLTDVPKTYEKMLKCVSESNIVQLLGPNGEVLKEVKK